LLLRPAATPALLRFFAYRVKRRASLASGPGRRVTPLVDAPHAHYGRRVPPSFSLKFLVAQGLLLIFFTLAQRIRMLSLGLLGAACPVDHDRSLGVTHQDVCDSYPSPPFPIGPQPHMLVVFCFILPFLDWCSMGLTERPPLLHQAHHCFIFHANKRGCPVLPFRLFDSVRVLNITLSAGPIVCSALVETDRELPPHSFLFFFVFEPPPARRPARAGTKCEFLPLAPPSSSLFRISRRCLIRQAELCFLLRSYSNDRNLSPPAPV